MLANQPVQVVYVQRPVPVRKKSRRLPHYFNPHNNQVLPLPLFTCIDEVYSSGPISQPPVQQTHLTSFSSSQIPKDDTTITTKTRNYRKWLLIIVIIVIIVCIITIIVLLAVFLTR